MEEEEAVVELYSSFSASSISNWMYVHVYVSVERRRERGGGKREEDGAREMCALCSALLLHKQNGVRGGGTE